MGHARALVSSGDEARQLALYNATVEEQWSVRQLERIIKDQVEVGTKKAVVDAKADPAPVTIDQDQFRHVLAERISAKIDIKKTGNGSGKLVINFNSDNDLNRIFELLNH
jgi:ParB family chromosome partitioning protein